MSSKDLDWAPSAGEDLSKRSYMEDFIQVCFRVSLAAIFWLSGRTKVKDYLSVTDSAIELFANEYKLPFIQPHWAAHLAAYAEHLFPVLLVLGLFTRVTALGMLLMTLVIQYVYPSAWPTHLSWAAIMIFLMRNGAGRFSLDRFVR